MYTSTPSLPATPTTWFNESLSRDAAIHALKTKEVGSFYVRKSAKAEHCYALSLTVADSKVQHYLIQQTEAGYRIKGCSKEFFTLQALVTHHSVMKEKLPVPLLLRRDYGDKQKRKVKDYESIESLDKILDEMRLR